MKKPKVSVIVLTWNQPEYTVNCVKSILEQSYADFELLIMDNHSTDNSMEIFKREFGKNPKIKILQTDKNRGYTGGNNFGVKHSKGDYIVILNNDTIVKKNWLKWLVIGLESDENVKVVGSNVKLVGRDKKKDYKNYGETKTLTGYTVYYKRKKPLENTDLIEVFSGGGCSFIYDRTICELPFPEEYFIYSEDTYFNWLAQLRGFKVLKATKSEVDHYHNVVKKSGGKKINFHFSFLAERNMYSNFIIFYSLGNLIKVIPVMLLKILLNNLMQPKKILAHIKAYLWILAHPRYFYKKRKEVQSQRKVPDKEIISKMSYKIYDEKKMPKFKNIMKMINRLIYMYCVIVRLKTIEFREKD